MVRMPVFRLIANFFFGYSVVARVQLFLALYNHEISNGMLKKIKWLPKPDVTHVEAPSCVGNFSQSFRPILVVLFPGQAMATAQMRAVG